MIRVDATFDGRGMGIFLEHDVSSGIKVIEEFSHALWLSRSYKSSCCGYCLKYLSKVHSQCNVCNRVVYCSDICKKLDNSEHTSICRILSVAQNMKLTEDQDSLLQLCCKVNYLKSFSYDKYVDIMKQSGDSITLTNEENENCHIINNIFQSLSIDEVNIDWIKCIFKKDKACGFAVMQPPHIRKQQINTLENSDNSNNNNNNYNNNNDSISNQTSSNTNIDKNNDMKSNNHVIQDHPTCTSSNANNKSNHNDTEDSVVRGFGVYPLLGMTNHSCLPNVARWDNFDFPDQNTNYSTNSSSSAPNYTEHNTMNSIQERRKICFRALYPLPVNTEIVQSYVPISWDLYERQDYLYEMFGFYCTCIRCKTEAIYEVLYEQEDERNSSSNSSNSSNHDNMKKDIDKKLSSSSHNDKKNDNDGSSNSEEDDDDDDDDSDTNSNNKSINIRQKYYHLFDNDSSHIIQLDDVTETTYDYIQLFLERHMCTRLEDGCTGILTPIIGFDIHNIELSIYECNVCYHRRSHQEYLNSLNTQNDDDDDDN